MKINMKRKNFTKVVYQRKFIVDPTLISMEKFQDKKCFLKN